MFDHFVKLAFKGLSIFLIQNRSTIFGFAVLCRQLILYCFLGFLGIHYHQFECRQKQILHIPKSTPNIGLLYETGIWPIKEKIEYSTIILFHSIMNSNDERISKKIIEQ